MPRNQHHAVTPPQSHVLDLDSNTSVTNSPSTSVATQVKQEDADDDNPRVSYAPNSSVHRRVRGMKRSVQDTQASRKPRPGHFEHSQTSCRASGSATNPQLDNKIISLVDDGSDITQDEETLFMSGQSNPTTARFGDKCSEESTKEVRVTDSIERQKKKSRKGIRIGPLPKTAKEWFAKSRDARRLTIPNVAGVKRKRSDNQHPSGKGAAKKLAVDGDTRKRARNGKSLEVMRAMFESLQHSNPIEARIELGDVPEADPIIAATKRDQLQKIMNNLPKDADKRNAITDERRLDVATRSFGLRNCLPKDGKWLITGMKTPLHAHQVIGTSWMLGREFSEDGPRGGIVADEMGIGKTLETLACIVSNRPTDDEAKEYTKSTLIIAPATAIQQWKEEIETHVKKEYIDIDYVLHYKGSKDIPLGSLLNMHIILASYQTIARQIPSTKSKATLKRDCRSKQEYEKKYNDKLGLLFKIPFWRVVLDEGHNIKNRESQTSIACQGLIGRHRWALSGTPITNSLDEFYPYFKFLKLDLVGNLKDYRDLYSNTGDETAVRRLRTIMDTVMIRRTMEDKFMGRPLYEIPKPYIDERRVRLTEEERIIYSVVEKRFRRTINDVLGQVQAEGRQIQETIMKKDLEQEDLLDIKRHLREAECGQPFFHRIGKWCAKKATAVGARNGGKNSKHAFGNSQFGYKFNMNGQLNHALAWKREDVCRICYQEAVDPQSAQCKHIFCKECVKDHIQNEIKDGYLMPRCPDCKKSLTLFELLKESDAENSDNQGSSCGTVSEKALFGGPKLGRDSFGKHPKLKRSQSEFLRQSDQAYPEPPAPSAKTTAVKDAILEWQSEAPDEKIIVFVEFKITGAILGRMLAAEGIQFLYLFGDLPQAEKDNAIQGFKEKKGIKVMIVSMKCGSVALNLTVANRVILVDLWWNVAIEMQAYSRVFRIGQEKETHFLRIVAENTIDDRMQAIQERKKENISEIMEPDEKKGLSAEEIMSLFGDVKKSADGNLEVVPYGEDDSESDEETDESEESDEDEDV